MTCKTILKHITNHDTHVGNVCICLSTGKFGKRNKHDVHVGIVEEIKKRIVSQVVNTMTLT